MNICEIIGLNVRRLRQERGLSQDEFAAHVEMDRSYLSEIENGQKNLSVMMLDQIATAFKVDITYFFKRLK